MYRKNSSTNQRTLTNQTHFSLAASRKRSRSSDERSQDGSQKKQRVFFTEEQKETLRISYSGDPYPSPARIEDLAQQVGVGTKTIVNWFHNHRMRAKQQPNGIKLELEDASNQSDAQSTSSNSPVYRTSSTNGSDVTTPNQAPIMNQWMFPSFEPVMPMLRRNNSALSNDSAQDLSTKAENGVQDLSMGGDSKRASPATADVFDSEYKRASPNTIEIQPADDNDIEVADPIQSMSIAEADQSNNNKPAGFILQEENTRKNRRKSSKPKWVYEGVALENAALEEAMGKNSPSLSNGIENLKASSEDGDDLSDRMSNKTEDLTPAIEVYRENGISLEKSAIDKLPEKKVEEWDDGADRHDSIVKLANNIRRGDEEDEDWEF